MQQPGQRVGVFVDVQNMYYSARALFDQRVDFGEILKEAVGDRQLVRAIAYVIQADHQEEASFFEALQERGFELRSKELLSFYGGNKKGDWDVGIAMDVVRMVGKLDVVVLVSGDGDFAELLRYAKSRGCRAEVMAFGSSASSALRAECDALFDLSQDTKRFLIPKKRGTQSRARKGSPSITRLVSSSTATLPIVSNAQNPEPAQRTASSQRTTSSVTPATFPRTTKRTTARTPLFKSQPFKKTKASTPIKRTPRITT